MTEWETNWEESAIKKLNWTPIKISIQTNGWPAAGPTNRIMSDSLAQPTAADMQPDPSAMQLVKISLEKGSAFMRKAFRIAWKSLQDGCILGLLLVTLSATQYISLSVCSFVRSSVRPFVFYKKHSVVCTVCQFSHSAQLSVSSVSTCKSF